MPLKSRKTLSKTYLSKSNANLKPGDIVLFYETPNKEISEIGLLKNFIKIYPMKKSLALSESGQFILPMN